ncbi:MAG: hypothetical protein ACHQU0_02930 [Candidatus Paceibacteria bacterium]
MNRTFLMLLVAFLLPTSAFAARSAMPALASFSAAQSLVAASSSPGNSYALGASVVLTAPVAGDFSALGGSVITAAPVAGDDLIVAGSVSSRASVAGDLRSIGGSIEVGEPVAGDLVALGFSVHDSGRAKGSVFIIAANATVSDGASGPVTIYGNNVALGGDFSGDVTVIAGGHLSLAPGTVIHGKLSYEAPDIASIPASVTISGGSTYTNASYLPDIGTSRTLAFLSIGFFLVARIIGMLILAGLFAGLFPKFAKELNEHVSVMRLRGILLATLLGFAILVATPLVIVLLALTFVGLGLAFLLLILYALLLLLSFIYAGILVGGLLVRRFWKREQVLWHDGVLGMTVLSLTALVPFIGFFVVLALTLFSIGMLLQLFFRFAFPHEKETQELL